MTVTRPTGTSGELVHPVLLQSVDLVLRPTLGEPVHVQTKVLDVEPQADGSVTIVVACPPGLDPDEHHFEAGVSWTYPLGRMECAVTTRPGTRNYGRVWLLCPSAPPSRLQQRAYFRARVPVPVALAWTPEPEDDEPVDPPAREVEEELEPERAETLGVAVDLSEGGVLTTSSLPLPPLDAVVEATVRVDGDNLAQDARVVRHVRFAGGVAGVAVTFLNPGAHGDRIRRLVFETERRRHRTR